MKNFLVNHFEKLILTVVIIICLFMIIGSVRQYLSKKEKEINVNDLKTRIEIYINTEKEPDLPPIPNYTQLLASKIEGDLVSLLAPNPKDIIYPPEIPALIKVIQKPRFALFPPIADAITYIPGKGEIEDSQNPPTGVAPSYNIIKIVFKKDDRQETEVENKFSNNFKGQKAVVIGAVLQRQLIHDGKKPLAASPWLTLTGSRLQPAWEEIENPATSTYIMRPDSGRRQRIVRNEPGPDAGGRYDELAPVLITPIKGKAGKNKKKSMIFSYEDTSVGPFRTYQYRFALVAAVQDGIRLFRNIVTPEDLTKDKNAVYQFDPEQYDPGENFRTSDVLEQAELKEFGLFGNVRPEPERIRGAQAEITGSPYYRVISGFSNVFKSTVETDSEIILSGQMADQISIYILKHFRYTIEQQTGNAQPGPAEGPFAGEVEGEGRPQQVIKKTLWADLLTSSLHSIKDRIGRKGIQVRGTEFADNKSRRVDFVTPYKLLKVGHSDFKEVKMVAKRELNEDGEWVEKLEPRERIIKDLLYIEVENIFTGKKTRFWKKDHSIIRRMRIEAAERRRRELEELEKEHERIRESIEREREQRERPSEEEMQRPREREREVPPEERGTVPRI